MLRTAPSILLIRNVFSNIGDEAMLRCEIEDLRRAFPHSVLTVLTDEPVGVRRRYEVQADFSEVTLSHPFSEETFSTLRMALSASSERLGLVQWIMKQVSRFFQSAFTVIWCRLFVWNARRRRDGKRVVGLFPRQKKLLGQLADADVVIGGGGLIPSLKVRVVPKTALYQALSILGVPLILHGQTLYPAPSLAPAYRAARRIILRDHHASRKTASALRVPAQVLVDGLDPAFQLPVADADEVMSRLHEIGLDALRDEFIAVNVRPQNGHHARPAHQEVARVLERYCMQHPSTKILLFTMQRYHGLDDVDDVAVARELQACFCNSNYALTLDHTTDPSLLKGILAHARCAVTSRYHGAVFALSQGVPAIGLSVSAEYDMKLSGVFEMFGMEHFVLPMRPLNAERLYETLQVAMSERDTLRELLRELLRERRERLSPLRSVLTHVAASILVQDKERPTVVAQVTNG